jgi:hypothetical protein
LNGLFYFMLSSVLLLHIRWLYSDKPLVKFIKNIIFTVAELYLNADEKNIITRGITAKINAVMLLQKMKFDVTINHITNVIKLEKSFFCYFLLFFRYFQRCWKSLIRVFRINKTLSFINFQFKFRLEQT